MKKIYKSYLLFLITTEFICCVYLLREGYNASGHIKFISILGGTGWGFYALTNLRDFITSNKK